MSTPPNTGSPNGTTETQRSSIDEAKHAGRDLRDKATETAQAAGQKAADHVRSKAEGAKNSVADEVSSFGDSLRKASGDMRHGSPQEQAFGYMADALADISDTVRGKNLTDLMGDLSDFGRRNPAAFLGGAALLGFAGMRLARASARDRYPAAGAHGTYEPSSPGSSGAGTGMAAHQSPAGSGSSPTSTMNNPSTTAKPGS